MRILIALFVFVFVFLSSIEQGFGCDAVTPKVTVNLSSDPNGVYTSSSISRDGKCCGQIGGSDKCIEFTITLHPDAEGVIFEVIDGAVPAILDYQIGCGDVYYAGVPACLNGPGPHIITFCKPGNNTNIYRITSVAEPIFPDTISVNDGCEKEIGTIGLDESTITWNSVYPGAYGAYNSYLSCSTLCDTALVTPQPGYPDSIGYEICGKVFGGCDTTYYCDTFQVNFYSTLDVNINPLDPTVCFGDTGTTITAIPSGGSPPYVYNWSNADTTQSTFVDIGTYIIELYDISGCPPTYDTIEVTPFSLPIQAITGNDTAACQQDIPIPINGQIIAASGGIWMGNGTFSPYDTSLSAFYTPTPAELLNKQATLKLITTGNGSCPADTDLIQISLLTFDATVVSDMIPVSCKGFSDGVAYVSASGTRSPFTYLWDAATGNQTNDSALMLPAGNYSVTVTDTAGCRLDTNTTVLEADTPLSLTIDTVPVICYGDTNGSATLTITGGVAPYSIIWNNSSFGTTQLFAGNLAAGTYNLSVTDSYGCTIDTTFIIGSPPPLVLTMSKVNVGCKDGNDGTATANISGGTAGYTYLWDAATGSQTTSTATGLSAGLYSVEVTDTNGCTISDTISLSEPPSPISFTYTSTQPSCYGNGDGTATVFPTGGVPPYTYLWDVKAGSQTTQTATGLFADTFSVTIFDQNSCVVASPIIVTDPAPLFATAVEIIHVKCKGGSTGSAKVIPTGGTPPYTFLWGAGTGFQTDSIAINLPAGIYSVFVNDQNACSYVPGIEILEPSDSLSIVTSSVPVSCKDGSDGMAIGEIFGGTSPYAISWDVNANSQTTDTALNLSAGTYTMSVEDANGCTADSDVVVIEPATYLTVSLFVDSVVCFQDSNGMGVAIASGGNGPYTIQWDANTGNQTGDTAYNLSSGQYFVNLSDNNGCVIDTFLNIPEPQPLSLIGAQKEVFCYGESTGWAWVQATGGNGSYSYQWDNAANLQTTDSAVGLAAGSYTVTVTDRYNCSTDSTFIIGQPAAPLTIQTGAIDVACYGDSNGQAYVIASGGTPPYTYQWGSNALAQTTDTAYNLKAGTYIIVVGDDLDCYASFPVTVRQPSAPLSAVLGKTDVRCFQNTNGKAFANVTGGTQPYSYLWNISTITRSTDTAKNLPSGTVYLQLTDTNGCFFSDSITLSEPPEVLIDVYKNDTICLGDNATITFVGSSGNGAPFTYELVSPQMTVVSPLVVSPTTKTNYSIKAYDVLGCPSLEKFVTISVRDLSAEAIELPSDMEICLGDTVRIEATHQQIYPPYDYLWNTGKKVLIFDATPTASRYYVLTVTNGCNQKVKDSVFVTVFPLPELDVPELIGKGCKPYTVSFENLATDTNLNSYEWNFGEGNSSIDPNPVFTFTEAGIYEIKLSITNNFGCTSSNVDGSRVEVFDLPTAAFTALPNITDIRLPIVEFTSLSTSGTRHYWHFEDIVDSIETNPIHIFGDTGLHVVKLIVIDENGCIDSVTNTVLIKPYFNLQIPNAFTPNTGGSSQGRYDPKSPNNFVFFPITEGVTQYKLMIFNRWGENLFISDDYQLGWDGYYKGKLSPQEVYVWKLDIVWENGQSYKGTGDVTLFR